VIKNVSLFTRKDGLSQNEFTRHWVEVHAPLVRAVPGLRRYVQSHILGERTREDIPAIAARIDGIAELWFDDIDSMARAQASPEAAAMRADAILFVGRMTTFIVEEKTILPVR
jgi:uncharacterized protein (TIGR02118 family)